MEILHVFGINWKLLVIQMINFAILLYVLNRYAYKPILRMVAERQRLIEKGVEDAKKSQDELTRIDLEKNTILLSAKKESDQYKQKSREEAEVKFRSVLDDAEKQAQRIIIEARKRGEEDAEKIRKESEKELARLVVLGAEKALRAK